MGAASAAGAPTNAGTPRSGPFMREEGFATKGAPTVISVSASTPNRRPYRRFESRETEMVWAAVEQLDIAAQHDLFETLTQELFVEPHLKAKAPSAREARAVLALREAAKLLGHSPSIKEFAEIGEVHPEYGWPHPSRVRAWLDRTRGTRPSSERAFRLAGPMRSSGSGSDPSSLRTH